MIYIVVFCVGALGMILELTGVRLMAPYFGTSFVVWTNIIGVFLGALSLGYIIGGKLGDKNQNLGGISFLMTVAGVYILVFGVFLNYIFSLIANGFSDLRVSSFIASLFIFAFPGFVFGMLVPFVIRVSLKSIKNAGVISGRLYALSTFGSIFGTFFAGFFLIPSFGTGLVFNLIGVFSIGIAVLLTLISKKKVYFMLLIFILSGVFAQNSKIKFLLEDVVYETDSLYSRLAVIRRFHKETGRPVLVLKNSRGAQSSMFLDIDNDLSAEYSKYFRLSNFFKPDIKKALMIGGGAYSYPKEFLRDNKEAFLDVVEIDPVITQIAKSHFKLEDDERLRIYHQDARLFMNANKNLYDAVFVDAYGSDFTIPFSLSTREYAGHIKKSLSEDGVVVTNVISSLSGEGSTILEAVYSTYKSVFPHVLVFAVSDNPPGEIQNVILVSFKSEGTPIAEDPGGVYGQYLSRRIIYEVDPGLVLTDDFAPVEYLTRMF